MFKQLTKIDDEDYNINDYDCDNYSFKEHYIYLKCVCDNEYYIHSPIETEHEVVMSSKKALAKCCNFCCKNKKHIKDDVFFECEDKDGILYLFQKNLRLDLMGFYTIDNVKKKAKKKTI